jgi:hypothetical protein
MLPAFKMLAKLKFLRGTAFDIFGYSQERKTERALISQYESLVDELLAGLTPANHALAVKLASVPDDIRGYGHVKDAHLVGPSARKPTCWRSGATRSRCSGRPSEGYCLVRMPARHSHALTQGWA